MRLRAYRKKKLTSFTLKKREKEGDESSHARVNKRRR